MPIEILMPALSPTMTEGNLAKWLKHEGDEVHSGDVLAEIETDKATMEVEAVDDGRVGKILVPEGTQGVKVNQPIALLLGEGEDAVGTDSDCRRQPVAHLSLSPRQPHRQQPQPAPATSAAARAAATSSAGNGHGRRFSPAPWPAAWRSRPASTLPRSSARGRKGGSSKPISMPRFRQGAPLPATAAPTARPAAQPRR